MAISYDPQWIDICEKRFENPLADAETFQVDQNSNLVEIGQKPESLTQVKGQFMGVFKVKPDVWERIKSYLAQFTDSEINKIDITKLLSSILKSDFEIHCVPIDDRWYEIDSQDDIGAYNKIISEKGSILCGS